MSNYYLPKLQAEYRNKIAAAGFKVVDVSEEEFEDGIGVCVGKNYIKDGRSYSFRDALELIGEYSNYRNAIKAECA